MGVQQSAPDWTALASCRRTGLGCCGVSGAGLEVPGLVSPVQWNAPSLPGQADGQIVMSCALNVLHKPAVVRASQLAGLPASCDSCRLIDLR